MTSFNIKLRKKNVILQINRPKVLNCLNLEMIQELNGFLNEFEFTKSMIIIKGNERSFCSGADVKFISQQENFDYGREFFKQEYLLNYTISKYRIPYVALIDGIVMGGGVGLSLYGKYRIATEHTLFAMPETAIGFFPDVGTSYFLSRMKHNLGLYLALTGSRLKGRDVVSVGIATHFCPRNKLVNLENELMELDEPKLEEIDEVLSKYEELQENYQFELRPILSKIEKNFNANNINEVFANLKQDSSEWAKQTLELLMKMSPISLCLTFQHLKLAQNIKNLKEILEIEYNIACEIIKYPDFKEGIRALLIDKTYDAKWQPFNIEEVNNELVNSWMNNLTFSLDTKSKY